MSQTHMILVSISMDLVAGQAQLKEVVNSLADVGNVVATSSIYKKFLTNRAEDLNSDLVMVLKIETERIPEEIFRFLKKLESTKAGHRAGNFVLLVYDQVVRLMPDENLPSPLLHVDSLTLRCAAEAWGSYEHPVLGQTLNELVRSLKALPHVEFFAQGRSLFSSESL